MTKLHLACGTVYLQGWINVDICGNLACEDPGLVKENTTTVANYYKKNVTRKQFMKGKFHKNRIVCDTRMDIRDMSKWVRADSVDKILGVQIFEHFEFEEAKDMLKGWIKLLKKGGSIQLHVPDTEGIIELYNEDRDSEWAIRQLYGSQKDEYALHRAGYTKESLCKVFKSVGLKQIVILPNWNSYPAFGIRGTK